jgi:uncharacterized protein (DUF1800 family)
MLHFSPRSFRVALVTVVSAATLLGTALLAGPGTPDIELKDNNTVVQYQGKVAYSPTPVGVPRSKTFTVTNTGSGNLLVSEAITVPVGFTVMATFPGVPDTLLPNNVPAFTIMPGASATFTVALNSALAGGHTGTVSFMTNVTGKNPFTFTFSSGRVDPPPGVRYTDDADGGFSATSGWTPGATNIGDSGQAPFQGSFTYAAAGTGTEMATWSFTGLEPGQYRVSATWPGYSWATTGAPFTVLDGSNSLGTVYVDQTSDSSGFYDGGANWQDLGVFTIFGSALEVQLTDAAPDNGYLVADGVRIERVGYPGALIDDSDASPSFNLTGTWETGYSQPGVNNYQGTVSRTPQTPTPGTPTATASWAFPVAPGQYRVMAGYHGYSNAATNSPFQIYDDSTLRATVKVNQKNNPADLHDVAVGWKDLGVRTVNGSTLTVVLSNDANGYVYADAVRIERCNTPTIPSMADTVRFLQQATWGATSATIDSTRGSGFNAWLQAQYSVAASSYPTLPSYNTNDKVTNNNTTSCYGDPNVTGNPARTACTRDHYSMYPLQNLFFTNAMYGDDQLRQRMAWSLHKLWVISGVNIRQPAWVSPYLQILSDEALGNYRTLMYKITLNSGMGHYLSMQGSVKAHPNENYPRELMQLFTIGLNELNPDGTNKLQGGVPIPTYDQTLVEQMTKVFTGWKDAPAISSGIPNYIDPMRLNGAHTENPVNHDFTRKTLLRGLVQPARTSSVANAYADLNQALDNIYNHPNVPPFVCKQLIQSLVTSNPSPAYVARVADVFRRNKTSTTQLQKVAQAILLDPEARGDYKGGDSYGHLKEPVLYLNNLLRMFDAQSANRMTTSDGYLSVDSNNLGQDVFRPASVFSYYSPGKVAVSGNPPVLGPEFQIQTTTTGLRRVNFMNTSFTPNSNRAIDVVRAAGTQPRGIDPVTGQPLVPTGPAGTAVDVSWLLPLASDPGALVDRLNMLMLYNTMSDEMRAEIVTAVSAVSASNARKRVHTAVYLIASSSQYQMQR